MSLQDDYLDALRWDAALSEARAGHPERLAFMLRGDAPIPPHVRHLLADRARLLVERPPHRRTLLAPTLLDGLRDAYAREPRGRRKAFTIEMAESLNINPASLEKLMRQRKGRK